MLDLCPTYKDKAYLPIFATKIGMLVYNISGTYIQVDKKVFVSKA